MVSSEKKEKSNYISYLVLNEDGLTREFSFGNKWKKLDLLP